MHRRTVLLGTTGLMANGLRPIRFALAQSWNPQVIQFVRDRQEREYLQLADALGLSSAKSAYEKIARVSLPVDVKQKYLPAGLPTPFEDARTYAILTNTFAMLKRELDFVGGHGLPSPFLATLPLGEVEARTTEEPKTKTPIVFFEHGLFSFLYDMAKLMAWAAPTLTEEQLTDDGALAGIPRKHTMQFTASQSFAGAFYSYVVDGIPVDRSLPIPEPSDNMGLAFRLLGHMERFVMAHELAHISANHLDKPQTPSLELDADLIAVDLTATLANRNHGSWAVGYWGAELALVALHLLNRAIGLVTFGTDRLKWISDTHPDPLTRRENLRTVWLNPRMPKIGITAAREMSGMTEALLSKLWEFAAAALIMGYSQRGARASPLWRKTAQHWQAA